MHSVCKRVNVWYEYSRQCVASVGRYSTTSRAQLDMSAGHWRGHVQVPATCVPWKEQWGRGVEDIARFKVCWFDSCQEGASGPLLKKLLPHFDPFDPSLSSLRPPHLPPFILHPRARLQDGSFPRIQVFVLSLKPTNTTTHTTTPSLLSSTTAFAMRPMSPSNARHVHTQDMSTLI